MKNSSGLSQEKGITTNIREGKFFLFIFFSYIFPDSFFFHFPVNIVSGGFRWGGGVAMARKKMEIQRELPRREDKKTFRCYFSVSLIIKHPLQK